LITGRHYTNILTIVENDVKLTTSTLWDKDKDSWDMGFFQIHGSSTIYLLCVLGFEQVDLVTNLYIINMMKVRFMLMSLNKYH